ncbi:MAG: response regulator transcription factor [Chloroflexota bacterium]|nr:response regulator transcription factor [Chloroflexota bacterium]
MKVLIIEDSREIVEAISLAFQIRWPEARLVSTHLGERGIEMAASESPDMIILDLGLPDVSGFEVLKQVRLFSDVPVLVLTVRSEEVDIVRGLEWGADDYIVKPFRQMELLARIRALIRRQLSPDEEPPLVCGELRFHPATRQLTVHGKEIVLTATETIILRHLMRNAGRVVTQAGLAREVWGDDGDAAAGNIKVYIRRLRQKIEEDPSSPTLIVTKPGAGYLMVRPDQSQ